MDACNHDQLNDERARRMEAGVVADAVLAGHWRNSLGVALHELRAIVADGQCARRELVLANQGLIHLVLRRLKVASRDYADAFHDGIVGLLWSVARFDYRRGAFGAYARVWIMDAVQQGRAQRAERSVRFLKRESYLQRSHADLLQQVGRSVATSELALATDIPEDVVAAVLVNAAVVLVAELDEAHLALTDDVDATMRDQLRRAVAQLPPNQRAVVVGRYGLDDKPPRSMTHLAAACGVSVRSVRNRLHQAHEALRAELICAVTSVDAVHELGYRT